MSETRQLREVWIEFIRKLDRFEGNTPEGFRRQVEAVADQYRDHLIQRLRQYVPNPKEYDTVVLELRRARDELGNAERSHIKQASFEYKKLYQAYLKLRDERLQQHWATSQDYFKLFIWRTLQGVMIGLIVIGTAWLAKILEIPLPLFRVV